MHIPDGVLSTPVLVTTGILAAGGVANGLRKIEYERLPRVAVMAAAFFVASLIHVPVGPTSSHLLLNGLMGLLIGWAAFPALLVALALQAVFFGFGGFTSLGANVIIMASPAVVVYYLFVGRVKRVSLQKRLFGLGILAGITAILVTCLVAGLVLWTSGKEFAGAIIAISIAHIPVAIIEGFVTGAIMVFLQKVRPELLYAPQSHSESEVENYA
jgi:cobalt/nickel transport system permease protein